MKKILKYIGAIILAILMEIVFYYIDKTLASLDYNIENDIVYQDGLVVHYLDVGQGDSIFIKFPNNKTMLIDAGEKEYGSKVVNYIKNLNYNKIDYIIATHPHTDHIGGLSLVIDSFDIGKIYMPKVTTTTYTYENLLKTIKNKGLKITTGVKGVNIINEDDLKVSILSPQDHDYDNLNNYSIVIKIVYKDRSFLFMGDSEKLIEKEITDDVSCDVLKIGHHGSSTSSSLDFLNKTNAKYAIISVAKNNDYHHPHESVIKNIKKSGMEILKTSDNGDIIISTDGIDLAIKKGNDNNASNN